MQMNLINKKKLEIEIDELTKKALGELTTCT